MKFESITMENFMRYKGRNHIEFSCDDVKNVTVVLGDNTVGKTTIAQAFRWGLYGALMANGTKSAGDFQLLNTDILEMMDANSRAKVKVEITAVDEEKRYIITRENLYQSISKVREPGVSKEMCDADYRVRGHGKLCRGRQQRDRDTDQ